MFMGLSARGCGREDPVDVSECASMTTEPAAVCRSVREFGREHPKAVYRFPRAPVDFAGPQTIEGIARNADAVVRQRDAVVQGRDQPVWRDD